MSSIATENSFIDKLLKQIVQKMLSLLARIKSATGRLTWVHFTSQGAQ